MLIRKNAAHLTPNEKSAFIKAIKAMKESGIYDNYVRLHAIASTTRFEVNDEWINGAHRGPAFLPWHRAMLLAFEKDLQKVSNSSMFIPYWDWTTDPYGQTVFTEDFMGGNGDWSKENIVTTGPFASGQWTTVRYNSTTKQLVPNGPLKRAFGQRGYIPDSLIVAQVMFSGNIYDSYPWNRFASPSFRANIENQLHDPVHVWVGGNMGVVVLAPNDPIFYLHHANIDRLWARWQDLYSTVTYEPENPIGPNVQGQSLNQTLVTLNQTPAEVWEYKQLGYTYERASDLRYFTGANYTGFDKQQATTSHDKVTVRIPPPPSGSEWLIPALTKWHLDYRETDHWLRVERMIINTPPTTPVPSEIQFTAGLQDQSGSRFIGLEGRAALLFLSSEIKP